MDPPPSSSSPAPQPEPAFVRPGRRVKRGVVYSDEEEDTTDTTSSRPMKGKAKVTAKSIRREIEAEKSLKAMMDIDDGAYFFLAVLILR